ncbi:MAG: GNAT family N-acetyltransferase [Anaerolineae bacterium]|nr:GNAT family N-acetyltransferase [Anaerolineae bacterium]
MTAPVSVRRVSSPAEQDALLRLPWKVYANDPHWVPPLVSMRREKLNPQHNPMTNYLDIEYFLAWRGAEPVGCIAAFINPRHNEYHHEHIGWFGLFDVLDDREAAHALLQTAEEWVRAKGYDAIRGPASFGDMDEFGLQVDFFDSPHVLLYPHNPPYYKTYIEERGYKGVMDLLSYRIAAEAMRGANVPEKIIRVMEKQKKRRNIILRNPDLKHFDADLDMLYRMYTNAWKDNWGFVPPSREELYALFNQFKRFLQPDFIFIAEINGEPAGFIMLFPDLNQAIKHARPHPDTPEFLTLLKVLWHWKVRPKVNRTRVPFLGVIDKYHGTGIDAMLYMAVVEPAVRAGFTEGDFGWVLDDNLAMNQISALVGGEIYNRFRIYQKALTPVD